jgi:truncated hemoglobin YjbI
MNITQEAYDEWLRLLKLSFLELKIEPKDVEKILRRIEIIKTKLLF